MGRRTMPDRDAVMFRAVVETTHAPDPGGRTERDREGWTYTRFIGPYTTAAPAKAYVTAAVKRACCWPDGRTVTGYVERSSITWERVE